MIGTHAPFPHHKMALYNFFFLILPLEATFFILSCHVLSLVEHELWVVSSRQDRRSAFPPFLVERTPLFPSMYSKRLRALGSSPSQTRQVLDAVPAKSGSVWFVLFPPPRA